MAGKKKPLKKEDELVMDATMEDIIAELKANIKRYHKEKR